jgi:chromate transport protein ChrA
MKKLFKFVGNAFAFTVLLTLLMMLYSCKEWSFPILLGLEGLALLLLVAICYEYTKAEWETPAAIGITGFLFLLSGVHFLLKNFNAPQWLMTTSQLSTFTVLILEAGIVGYIAATKLLKKSKRS